MTTITYDSIGIPHCPPDPVRIELCETIIEAIRDLRTRYEGDEQLAEAIISGDPDALVEGLTFREEATTLQHMLAEFVELPGDLHTELTIDVIDRLLGISKTALALSAATGDWDRDSVQEVFGFEAAARFEPLILKREISRLEHQQQKLREATSGRAWAAHEQEYAKMLRDEIFQTQLRLIELGHLTVES